MSQRSRVDGTEARPVKTDESCAAADLVQLLVVGDGQQDVTRCDATFLVVSCCIACQLQYLSWGDRKTFRICQ